MKKDSGLIYRLILIIGDALALVLSFAFAYYYRTHVDPNPFFFESNLRESVVAVIILLPLWIIVLATLGLYQKNIFLGKSRLPELGRLILASIIGTMGIITADFLGFSERLPARSIAFYSTVFCFIALVVIRLIIRIIRGIIVRSDNFGVNIIITGNNPNTEYLADYISTHPEAGYNIVGIVAGAKFIPKGLSKYHFSSLKESLKATTPDAIFQTDEYQKEYVYRQAVLRHLSYYFVPTSSSLSAHTGQVELVGDAPTILVKTTPLIGGARIAKRFFDITLSLLGIIVAAIPMFIIGIILKLSDPKHPALYSEYRLSRFNKTFKIYKFRSMKAEYSGMSPEDAFKKMNKPELVAKYRKNGDYLENDPRITKIGKFIRKTSLDELPQLFNVLKGDISLVGPRALVPGELRNYGDRSLLLSVKSGLTGLAQVSGRRDISFEERRALDVYYIQNWTLLLDLQIILRTFSAVFKGKGAK